MSSPSTDDPTREHSEMPKLRPGQRICERCSKLEKHALRPHPISMPANYFKHYIYFDQICTAARLGCQLCQILEQGIVHARFKRVIGPPGSVVPIHSIEHARTYLQHQDSLIATLHKNGEWNTNEHRYIINMIRERFICPSSNESWSGFSSFRILRSSKANGNGMEKEYAKFMLCVLKDSNAFLQGHFCGREVLPSFDISLAKEWLSTCVSSHKCQPIIEASPITIPRRLIQILNSVEGLRARLISPPKNLNLVYTALSYRWSEGTAHVSSKQTLPIYEESIPLEMLPAAIRDAILITVKLDLQYLWVDSLCIAQDSKREWEEECAKMSSIYANAIVTLAHAGTNPSNGFLRSGSSYPYPNSCILKYFDAQCSPVGEINVRYVHDVGYVGYNSHTEPWGGSTLDTRGWTLQERLLSSRVLTFDEDKMWWECYSGRMIESIHLRPIVNLDPKSLFKRPLSGQQPEIIYRWWHNALMSFSNRKLTFPMDRLPAISGVAKIVQSLTSDVYLAGLWQDDLPRGLVWSSDLNYNLADAEPKDTKTSYRGPSWSWARSGLHLVRPLNISVSGEEVQSFITFVSASVDVNVHNPFGHVSPNCVLTIKAPARSTKISKMLEKDLSKNWIERVVFEEWAGRSTSRAWSNKSVEWALGSHSDGSYNPELRATLDDTPLLDISHRDVECIDFLAIRISTFRNLAGDRSNSYGLILQQVDHRFYRRVAIFKFQDTESRDKLTEMDSFFASANIKTIAII